MAAFCGPFCGRFHDDLQGSSDEEDEDDDPRTKDLKIRGSKKKGGAKGRTRAKRPQKEESSRGASAALRWSNALGPITPVSSGKNQKRSEAATQQVTRLYVFNRPDHPASMFNSISQLTGVHTIEIIKCEREDIPPGLPDMEGLAVVRMSDNLLTKFPEDLAKIKSIEHIRLDNNRISDFAPNIFGRSFLHLEVINLSHNRLTILPNDFGLTAANSAHGGNSLRHIDLSYNFIQSLPENVAKCCVNLEVLILSHNNLKTLGEDLALKKLQRLFVSFNQLQKLPENIGECKQLAKIRISQNQIRVLPESMLKLWRRPESRGGAGGSGVLEEFLVDNNPLVMPSITTFDMAPNNSKSIDQAFEIFEECLNEKKKKKKLMVEIAKQQEMDEEEKQRQLQKALEQVEASGGGGRTAGGGVGGGGDGGAAAAILDRQGTAAVNQNGDLVPAGNDSKQNDLPDYYYFNHCKGDPRMIAEIRNTESTLLFVKKNWFVERMMAAAHNAQESGYVPAHLEEFLQPGFSAAAYDGKVSVSDLDLYFNLLVMTTKPMFSTCHTLFDKFEVGGKGYMSRDEWSECCMSVAVSLDDKIVESMWELMAWRSANKSKVLLTDFVAAWHIHDIECRDMWIARIADVLKLDYYDMDPSELMRRLRAKDSQDASPDVDFDVQQVNEHQQDQHVKGDDAAAHTLTDPNGLRTIWYSPLEQTSTTVVEDRRDMQIAMAGLSEHVSLSNDQQLELDSLMRLTHHTLEDGDAESLNSEKLSDDTGSEVSEFDAATFLQQHAELMHSHKARAQASDGGAAFVVDNDEKIQQLMNMSPEEFKAARCNQAEAEHARSQFSLPVTKSRKRAKKEVHATPSRKMKTDVFAVRQVIRRAYRSMPVHDFSKLNSFMLRAMNLMKHSPKESRSYWHADDPTFRHSMGVAGRNRYTRELLFKMGFVTLTVSNGTYWVWPSVHLDAANRGVPTWGDRQVPHHCPGKDKNRLDDMITLLLSCQRELRKKGPSFTGHFRSMAV